MSGCPGGVTTYWSYQHWPVQKLIVAQCGLVCVLLVRLVQPMFEPPLVRLEAGTLALSTLQKLDAGAPWAPSPR